MLFYRPSDYKWDYRHPPYLHSTYLLRIPLSKTKRTSKKVATIYVRACENEFDWLTSKQPQASHLVVTDKTEQLFSEITILLYQEVEMIHGLSMQSSEYGKPYNS